MNKVLDLTPPEPVQESSELQESELPIDAPLGPSVPEALSWQAHHPLSERGWYRHYIALSGFGLVGATVSFWQGSWLTLAVFVLGIGAWELHERMAHPVKVAIDETAVWVNGREYPHTELASFDLHRMADGTYELCLEAKTWHTPHMRLPLGEQSHEQVWTIMAQYVPQGTHLVPRLDRWLRS